MRALALLVGSFCALTVVAYSDFPRAAASSISDQARQGLDVWRRNNCQVCHQIHGFGGFHGPDLTNRLTDGVLDVELMQVISTGRGRMPAFEFSEDDLDALVAWLRWMDGTGQAQPEPLQEGKPPVASMHFQGLVDMATDEALVSISDPARQGLEVWTTMQCGTCHRPFQKGLLREPDLTAAATDRSFENMRKILSEGLGRMPATPLDDTQVRALQAFLEWVALNRSVLAELNLEFTEYEPFSWSKLPWFEYR